MFEVTLTYGTVRAVREALGHATDQMAVCEAGVSHRPHCLELISRGLRWIRGGEISTPKGDFIVILVNRPHSHTSGPHMNIRSALLASSQAVARAVIEMNRVGENVHVHASGADARGVYRNIGRIQLVWPQLPILQFARPEGEPSASDSTLIWSRTIGALGVAAWERLRSLRYCIVGIGRTGSVVAVSLTRLGARNLSIIDQDICEPHNLDSMDGVQNADIGKHKVKALQRYLAGLPAGPGVAVVSAGVTTYSALTAIKESDVLFCCVDNDVARVACAVLSTLYGKPMMDIGTGIFDAEGTQRIMGGDVRLVLPGECCLLCFGGVVRTGRTQAQGQQPDAWRRERSGSLRSLNAVAAHLALRLWEDFVSGRVTHSTWERLNFSPNGTPSIETVTPSHNPNRTCQLCRMTGLGDAGLDSSRAIFGTVTQGQSER